MNENDTLTNGTETGLEIAVVGMAARFPGAKTIAQFWENLKNGVETISFFSAEELAESGIDPAALESPNYVKAWGILEDIEYFDADFFNYTPKEADIMDPQLRQFQECAWHALEDAGYNPDTYRGITGLYAGNAPNSQWLAMCFMNGRISPGSEFTASLLNEHFSTQVSYRLNLPGPGISLRTACSTALVAIHLATLGLLSSECDMALAGGVTVQLPQKTGYFYREGMILSADGHCRTFDTQASGSVFGNGVGVVVLKRYADARADHDFIYALIKGSAVNNDAARRVGYTAPSVEGQAAVVRSAHMVAGVEPASIGYIEAHGTATPLGDPVEIEALSQAFNTSQKQFCAIGSVKTNLGHLNAAAGVAGFIKTVLALKHRCIPPSLHFHTLNPKIRLAQSPFYINTASAPWKNNTYPRRAGVSAFGLGGTNAHVVLEEAPVAPLRQNKAGRQDHLLLLSAKTSAALDTAAKNLAEFFNENPHLHLAEAAFTLQVGRKPFQHRRMLVCGSTGEASQGLLKNPTKVQYSHVKGENPPVIFMFPGQGDQYPGMGLDLYRSQPLFREKIHSCIEILKPLMGNSIETIFNYFLESDKSDSSDRSDRPDKSNRSDGPDQSNLSNLSDPSEIHRTEMTQPLLFSFEYALAGLLMELGLRPHAMIGYSLGEYVAACISGVFTLEDALKLVFLRGKLMQEAPVGVMLSVPLPEPELKPLLNSEVSLAIDNGPSCIIAGPPEAVAAFEKEMQARRLVCMRVNMGHAAHSLLMNPVRDRYESHVEAIPRRKPGIPYISNVSGTWISVEEAMDPGYWGTHLCSTVQFSRGLSQLLEEERAVFIEIGPGRGIANLLRQHPARKPGHWVIDTVKHPRQRIPDDTFLLSKLGQMWLYGVPIAWAALYGEEQRNRIPLPGYPFARERYWLGVASSPQVKPESQDNAKETIAKITPPPAEPGPATLRERPNKPDEITAPRDELEKLIVGKWQEVLGYSPIGIDENFFDLNGDSLTATQLFTRLQQIFPIELSLQEFFAVPTVASLAGMIKKALAGNTGEKGVKRARIPRRQIDGPVPLSYAQQRLWLLDRLVQGNPFYNMPFAYLLQGDLVVDIFQQSLDELVKRHESLRTTFAALDGQPMQVIAPEAKIAVNIIDFREFPGEQQEAEARRLAGEEARKPFNLEQGPLLRVTLVVLEGNRHLLLLTMHHIISDGWSMGILIREMAELLAAFSLGKPSPLQPLPVQYADYALWQRQRIQGDLLEKQLSFWNKYLAGHLPVLELPVDHQRPAVPTYRGAKHDFHLPETLSTGIQQLTRQQRCSLFMTLLAALDILFCRFSGQEDIMIGIPNANRSQVELEGIIGFFVNTLVIRIDLSGNPSFPDLLAQVREVAAGAFDNQDLPFEKLLEEFQPQRYRSHNPVYQVMFNFHNIPLEQASSTPDLAVQPLDIHNETSKFDLWISISLAGQILRGTVEYNTDLFEAATISRLTCHLQTLLEGIVETPDCSIADLPLLTGEEKQQLVADWNFTVREYNLATLHRDFARQVAKTPTAAALIYEDHNLCYDELNRQVRKLASYLRAQGVETDRPVGILMERSLEMVIGLLAILTAGGAYLPLDPGNPQEQIEYLLKDSGATVLLVQESSSAASPSWYAAGPWVVIDLAAGRPLTFPPDPQPPISLSGPSALAYLIYTSGTTGKRKGVMISHRSICNRLCWMQETYKLTERDRVLQKTPFGFDVSVWEFFWPLITGAALVMAKPGGHKDTTYLVQAIIKYRITTIHFVPAMLNVFLESPALPQPGTLKRVICSGEALSVENRDKFLASLEAELHNLYGPTEAAVDVTAWHCHRRDNRPIVPIGQPIANTQIHIFDTRLNLVPIGVPGELHIGGIQLARGYLNQPELTSEKFLLISNNHYRSHRPHRSYITYLSNSAKKSPPKLYKTGDLARWQADGNIEFLGRIDNQVKIRGFRVEPAEIRSRLLSIPGIAEAVVTANPDKTGGRYLCAYIVYTSPGEPIDTLQIRERLLRQLPEYMVPLYFVPLPEIPLTANGKVDRKALPVPEIKAGEDYAPPRNDVEKRLVEIWSLVLGISKDTPIGINDNFYAWGGNSLSLIRMAAEIYKEFGTEVPIVQDFQDPCIREISRYIIDRQYVSGEENPVLILNPSQEQVLFCFPPVIGYGIAYMELPNYLKDFTLYSFNFIEDENRIDRYVELIRGVQPVGPYRMFAYSAGGELAVEVARRLEEQGQRVSDLILMDCRRAKQQWQKFLVSEFLNTVIQGLEAMGIGFLKERVIQKVNHYTQYVKNLQLQPIDTVIHLITSLERQESNNTGDSDDDQVGWAELTRRECILYKGSGLHINMLNQDHIEENTAIIKSILSA